MDKVPFCPFLDLAWMEYGGDKRRISLSYPAGIHSGDWSDPVQEETQVSQIGERRAVVFMAAYSDSQRKKKKKNPRQQTRKGGETKSSLTP